MEGLCKLRDRMVTFVCTSLPSLPPFLPPYLIQVPQPLTPAGGLLIRLKTKSSNHVHFTLCL